MDSVILENNDKDVSYLVFDIESIPDVDLIKEVKYPGENLSDQDAVKKLQDEILTITDGKSNFIPVTFQKPLCVVVGKVDSDFMLKELVSLDAPEFRPEKMTSKFWYGIEELYPKASLVTFNGRGFDVPLLELMAYRYNIKAKRHFTDKFGTRYRYGTRHIDLQEFLSNYFSIKMAGGLNLLAKVLGMPGKMGTDGSEVYDLYLKNEISQINDYCTHDVLDTYFVFLRTRVLLGKLDAEKEIELVKKVKNSLKDTGQRIPALKEYIDNCKEPSPFI